MEIDTTKLKSDLADITKRDAAIAEVITSIKGLVSAFNDTKNEVKKLETESNNAVLIADQYLKASDELIATIKNIHIALNAQDEKDLEELRKELGKFILTPAAIESGARREARIRNEALKS